MDSRGQASKREEGRSTQPCIPDEPERETDRTLDSFRSGEVVNSTEEYLSTEIIDTSASALPCHQEIFESPQLALYEKEGGRAMSPNPSSSEQEISDSQGIYPESVSETDKASILPCSQPLPAGCGAAMEMGRKVAVQAEGRTADHITGGSPLHSCDQGSKFTEADVLSSSCDDTSSSQGESLPSGEQFDKNFEEFLTRSFNEQLVLESNFEFEENGLEQESQVAENAKFLFSRCQPCNGQEKFTSNKEHNEDSKTEETQSMWQDTMPTNCQPASSCKEVTSSANSTGHLSRYSSVQMHQYDHHRVPYHQHSLQLEEFHASQYPSCENLRPCRPSPDGALQDPSWETSWSDAYFRQCRFIQSFIETRLPVHYKYGHPPWFISGVQHFN